MHGGGRNCRQHVQLSSQGQRAGAPDAGSLSTGVASDTGVVSGTKAVSGNRDDTSGGLYDYLIGAAYGSGGAYCFAVSAPIAIFSLYNGNHRVSEYY